MRTASSPVPLSRRTVLAALSLVVLAFALRAAYLAWIPSQVSAGPLVFADPDRYMENGRG